MTQGVGVTVESARDISGHYTGERHTTLEGVTFESVMGWGGGEKDTSGVGAMTLR